jgi:N-acetylglutamate synthase-like GNAT family acetyltransferase
VVEIDAKITGRARRLFFEKRLEAALADAEGFIAVALEGESGLEGFAIARVQHGEFDDAQDVASLDVIGVDPACQGGGRGRQLLAGVEAIMGERGIGELRTQVDWNDRAMTGFFAETGFALAPQLVLERETRNRF